MLPSFETSSAPPNVMVSFKELEIIFSPLHIRHLLNREGIAIFSYSFIGPVGHNIWWENSRIVETGLDLKMVNKSSFLGLKIWHFFFGGLNDVHR